jgi:spore germination protein KB
MTKVEEVVRIKAKRFNISSRQLMLLMLTGITGTIFFGAVRLITTCAGAEGYMAIVGGGLLSFLVILASVKIGSLFPNHTPFDYAQFIFGKWVGKLVALTLVLFNLLAGSLILRALGDFLLSAILPYTPLSAAILLMLFLVIVGAYMGLETLSRFNEGFYPLILLSWILVLIAVLPNLDIGWLRPLFDIELNQLANATLVSGTFLIDGLLVLMFYPYVSDQKLVLKYCTWSVVVGTLILGALQIAVVGLFSPALAQTLSFPVLELAQDASLGVFLERIEAVYLAVWIVGTFIRVAIVYYAASLGVSQVLGWKDHRWYVLPVAVPVFLLAFQAKNVAESFTFDALFAEWGVMFQVGITSLLLLGAVIRKRGATALAAKKLR